MPSHATRRRADSGRMYADLGYIAGGMGIWTFTDGFIRGHRATRRLYLFNPTVKSNNNQAAGHGCPAA